MLGSEFDICIGLAEELSWFFLFFLNKTEDKKFLARVSLYIFANSDYSRGFIFEYRFCILSL